MLQKRFSSALPRWPIGTGDAARVNLAERDRALLQQLLEDHLSAPSEGDTVREVLYAKVVLYVVLYAPLLRFYFRLTGQLLL